MKDRTKGTGIDAKHLHRELVNRRTDQPEGMDMYHWQDGWNKADWYSWAHGFLWGIVIVIAVMVFL